MASWAESPKPDDIPPPGHGEPGGNYAMPSREETNAGLRALRTRGYQDALAGRARANDNPVYQAAYRRGVARRQLLQAGGMEKG